MRNGACDAVQEKEAPPIAGRGALELAIRHSGARAKRANSDVRLHIGESYGFPDAQLRI